MAQWSLCASGWLDTALDKDAAAVAQPIPD
jgi:hypothetical protein